MITLNLIPENQKKELQLLNFYIAVKNFVFIIFIGTVFSAMIFLIGRMILITNFEKMVTSKPTSATSLKLMHINLRGFKQEIDNAKEIQKGHLYWTNFFRRFNVIVNDGVIISQLNLNNRGDVAINGIAKDRNDLIKFEDNINKSGYFDEFKFPYEIFFQKSDIFFTAKLKFDLQKLTTTE